MCLKILLSYMPATYSQCLCMVVDAACKKNCESFQTLLENLLLMLHTYVSCEIVHVT